MSKKFTTKEVIQKSKERFGEDALDYSLLAYVDTRTKFRVTCKKCGRQRQENLCQHLRVSATSCRKCYNNSLKFTTTQIIEKIRETHGNKFDCSLVDYKDTKTQITLICNHCRRKTTAYARHIISGSGCSTCAHTNLDTAQFIKRVIETHGEERFSFPDTVYINQHAKVKIWCNRCEKNFEQEPRATVHEKQGCPDCTRSRGEETIARLLKENNTPFKPQKTFPDCRSKKGGGLLRFDFYLLRSGHLIEFQGEQHYRPFSNRGGIERFEIGQSHDEDKVNYCLNNNIPLIVIPYYEPDIKARLRREGLIP